MSRYLGAIAIIVAIAGSQFAGAVEQAGQIRGDAAEATELARMLDELKVGTVADIGAGYGGFTAMVAKRVTGTVRFIATELPAQMSKLSQGVRGVPSIRTVEGAPTDTNLPAESCDALIVRLTYHDFDRPAEMAASLFRTLRHGGALFVIEMPRVHTEPGGWDGIMPDVLVEQLQKAGFTYQRTVSPFDVEWHTPLYLMVLQKP